MYLVSIYFEEHTTKHLQSMINQVAKKNSNTFMVDGKVPPHITVSAFETMEIESAIQVLDETIKTMRAFPISLVSVGTFLPSVIYIAAVYDEKLHQTSKLVYDALMTIDTISIQQRYRPFQWLPHVTIGKKMTQEQLLEAFRVLQNQFGVLQGKVVKIGLAKTNPYRDLMSWGLSNES